MAKSRIAEAYVQIVPRVDGVANTLKDQLSGEMDKAGNDAGGNLARSVSGGFGGKIKGLIGPAIAGLGATLAVGAFAGFMREGIAGAEDLNIKLREVVTLTGQTGDEADATFTEFASLVKGVSAEFGIAQDVLTGGLYQALSAGVPRENAMTFLQVASQAAIAGVTDVETAVDGITTIVNAFGLSAEDAAAVSDSLFTAVKGGKTTFGELSASLFNVGPAAAAAGVSFEEVNAAIAALTASGTPTTVATTQIRAALVGLQRPSEDLDAIFQSLGYENAQLAIESEGLQFALDAVKDASGGSNGELQKLLGSVEAVGAVNVLAGTGAEKFTAELAAQSEAAGATAAAFDEVDKGRNSERLRIAFENLSLSLGTLLLPSIETLANFMTTTLVPAFETHLKPAIDGVVSFIRDQLIPTFANIFNFIKDNIPTIATFVGVLTGLTVAFNAVTIAINVVRIATTLWSTAQAILNGILALNPIGLIIIAVAALAAGIVFLATKTTFFQDTWKAMTDFASKAWEGFKAVFETVSTAIGNFFGTLVTNIKDGWNSTVEGIRGALGFLSDTFDTVFQNITGFLRDYINGWIGFAEGFVNYFIRGINNIIKAFNSIKVKIPDWVPGIGGRSFGVNIPTVPNISLPRLAKGGFVDQPTTALIGEAGPEVVTPLKDFERMMGLDGSSGRTINYYAAPNQSLDAEQALFQAMKRAKVVAAW